MSILAILSVALVILLSSATHFTHSSRRDPAVQAKIKEQATTADPLLEIGTAQKQTPAIKSSAIKLLSYNIRWRGGEDLKKLIELFRHDEEIGQASILALQEVDRKKQRTRKVNTAKQIANALGFNYAWAAPPPAKPGDEEETGVALMSKYPMSNVERIVLPHEGPGKRRRVALGASVKVGETDLRVYSVHGETRIPMSQKVEQMNAVIQDLDRFPKGTHGIVMGDLNTWEPDADSKTIKLFSGANFTTPFGSQKTFQRKVLFVPIDLRLDWVWLRNLEAVSHGINRKITISDHFPLWVTIKTN